MEIRSPSPRKKPAFLRKSSIYDDTPLAGMEYYWNCPWSLLFIDDFKPREDYYMMSFFCRQGQFKTQQFGGRSKERGWSTEWNAEYTNGGGQADQGRKLLHYNSVITLVISLVTTHSLQYTMLCSIGILIKCYIGPYINRNNTLYPCAIHGLLLSRGHCYQHTLVLS